MRVLFQEHSGRIEMREGGDAGVGDWQVSGRSGVRKIIEEARISNGHPKNKQSEEISRVDGSE